MKKHILIFLFLISLAICHAQQNEERSNNEDFLQISAIPAFSQFDLGSLNPFLNNHGFLQAKDSFLFTPSFSISTSFDQKNVLNVTVGYHSAEERNNGQLLEQEFKFGEMGFDRYLFRKDRSSLFLGFSFGTVWYNIHITQNGESGSFSEALSNPVENVKISSKNNSYIALKTGYDWAFGKNREILIGGRLGYRIGLNKRKWEINNTEYDDSPESSAKGFFLGIALSLRK